MMTVPALAFRSLVSRKRQYFPLFLVCAVCSGLSFFVFFLSNGMTEAFRDKARIYYGGDLQFIGGVQGLAVPDAENTMDTLRSAVAPDVTVTARLEFDGRTYSLFYEGSEVVLRVIKGVDFQRERSLFSRFTYVPPEGSGEGFLPPFPELAGTNVILISNQLAGKLGVRQNDVVTFFCRTVQGYLNSVNLRVGGIFLDSSVLGLYTAYCDIEFLRRTMGVPENLAHRISFIFPSPPPQQEIRRLQDSFSEFFPMYPLVSDKELFYHDLIFQPKFGGEPVYALITLDANQEDLQELTGAMHLIFSIIVVMLSGIIIAGIGSTYRVLILKRVNEIGIFMSIGMRNGRIALVLFLETMLLLVSGCLAGFAFSGLLCLMSGALDLSSIPGVDIFLRQGVLAPVPDFAPAAVFCLVIFVTTGLAVLFTIRRTVSISPAEVIRATE